MKGGFGPISAQNVRTWQHILDKFRPAFESATRNCFSLSKKEQFYYARAGRRQIENLTIKCQLWICASFLAREKKHRIATVAKRFVKMLRSAGGMCCVLRGCATCVCSPSRPPALTWTVLAKYVLVAPNVRERNLCHRLKIKLGSRMPLSLPIN